MTSTTRNGFPQDAHSAAAIYIGKNLAPIPLPSRSKDPGYSGWPSLRLSADTIDRYFPTDQVINVGILNGLPSHNALDVDLDCAEARNAAGLLLPATGWVFGRKSSPRSHWIYKTDISLDSAQDEYKDLAGEVLVELRGTGGLTVYPPSLHKDSGERITWEKFAEPGQVKLADLQQAVRHVAAAALLARHWPAKGSRDAAAMALSGGLTRAGWDEEQVSRFVRAVAQAAGDEEAGMRAGKAGPTARKQDEGKKTTGWPALEEMLGEQGIEVVKRVRDWLGLSAPARIADITPEAAPWPDPPAEEAFYGLSGRIVRTILPSTEADPAALLVQVLVAFGSAAGRAAHFRVEGDYHFTNEFAVLVGRTSKARKGTSWGRVRQVMELEEQWHNERVVSGVSSGQGLIWAVRDAIQTRERTGEGKYDEVEKDPGIEDKRLLVYEPEFANVLKQTLCQDNTVSVVLRQAWDGYKHLRTLTKNSPAKATGAHISLVGHITGEELQRYLTRTETANGFANRFMFVCADRSKLLPEGGHVDADALDALRAELVEALAFAKSTGEVRRDDKARAFWYEIYGELSEGKPGLVGALLARAEAHVMRLAMLYALFDCSETIKPPHLLAALALWDYCDRSVRYIFGDSLGDDVADELLRLLRGCPNGLTRTDINNYYQRNVSSNRIGKALGLLLQHKLARREEEDTGGRKAERWYAARK
jgi:hypothetical protein